MSIHASVHLHDDSVIEGSTSTITPGHGYLTMRPLPTSTVIRSVIHARAPELRRLASAALRLAAELDPPAKTYRDDFANSLALASYGRMADREDECPRMGENR